MLVRVRDIVTLLERFAPPYLAEPDDPIGLQIGHPDNQVSRISVALEVTEEVAEEAIREGAQLIFAHHPLIYRPLKSIRTDRPEGKLVGKLLVGGISVYVAHTNLDAAHGGINDMMAEAIGLSQLSPLRISYTEPLYKLSVFVPSSHLHAVQEAIFSAGAGHIGNYSRCSFNVEGFGTFMPEEGSEPYIGTQGKTERVSETKVETIVPAGRRQAVVEAMLKAHPYEEVAYDIYALELKGKSFGLGRVGMLPEQVELAEFARKVKEAFGVPAVRVVGDADRKVSKAAVLGGSGKSFLRDAIAAGADVFVTGDFDHHTAHDALAAGVAIVDPGHHAEQIMKRGMADWLNGRLKETNAAAKAYASAVHTEPFKFI
ncbi:Nif3-like dinuclear metal center hexameric protein [Paenibacillus alkalitolerans]|uniref:Nif3-like dinuclear metal center hexameric protein n=1 Tax=Paenibacillus alkalitolerans TaxID=2799335 RepID=UPI0018F3A4A3|nr:Nif3-like dinuclear metal center hexameric protein [Paenibacillus alkalitolerans]